MSLRLSRSLFALAIAVGLGSAAITAILAEPAGPPAPPPKSAPAAAKPASANAPDPKEKEENLLPVLDPGQFFGPAAMGYSAAKNCAHVCNKLFCYCGCDITDNHKCLLDCFTGTHGVDCHICQEEAMVALRMSRNDEPIGSIQKTIDETYSSKYPFKEESPALKKYKATRKWNPSGGGTSGGGKGDGDTCCGGK